MKSLQLVCINYGNIEDAYKVTVHCLDVFPRIQEALIIHPGKETPLSLFDARTLRLAEHPDKIKMVRAYSPTQNECCMYEMPKYITCDHAIGIQWDGFIVNPDAWTDEFLEYDYVAPPWPLKNIVNPEWRVGSGGAIMFSKRMAQLWGSLCAPHPEPNDWQMGAIQRASFEKRGIKYAPLELAMRFGEEIPLDDQPKLGYTPFMFHGFQYGDHEKWRKQIYG